jgi:hypothetical protein
MTNILFRKCLLWGACTLLFFLTLAGGQLWQHRAYYASQWMTHWMQVPTTVQHLTFSKGTLHLHKVVVASPEGGPRSILTVDRVSLRPSRWDRKGIAFEQVEMVRPVVTIEQNHALGKGGSWTLLLNRLQLTGEADPATRLYQIDNFKLVDLTYRVPFRSVQPEPLSFLEIHGFAASEPLSSRLMVAAIFRRLLEIAERKKITTDLTGEIRPSSALISIGDNSPIKA